ncbi:MAG TPA: HlyD family efflux transporter periplasmic adaptor subunit [Clostridia bacterium]|nr:HlyD family efflux transporter periplasmic adaptor subunit [Clostridia bacterium]
MTRGIIIGNRRMKLRFLVFLIITLLGLSYLISLTLKRPLYDVIQYGEITTWDKCQGIIVRDEKPYFAPAYGKVDFCISDGEMVEENDPIAILFKDNYNKMIMEDLYKIRQKISDYQNKNLIQDLIDTDYDRVQEDIEEILHAIQYGSVSGAISEMGRHEYQLKGLLSERKAILDKRELSNNYLDHLLTQENDMKEILDEWRVDIISPETGFISFKLDGLETQLTPGTVDLLTLEGYMSFLEHQVPDYNNNEIIAGVPLFKVVIPDKWYIISLIPNKNVLYERNDSVKITLPGSADHELMGKVYKTEYLADSVLIALEMTDDVVDILGARNVHLEIGTQIKGLMIPNKAIVKKRDKTGINVLRDGKIQYLEIQVQATDGERSIISRMNETDILDLNDKILVN